MELLQDTYSRKGTIYKKVIRNDKAAIYEQYMDNRLVGYEVFIIRIQREFTFPNGTVNPEKESFPGDSQWGNSAWSYCTLKSAQKRYDEITKGILRPEYPMVINDKLVIKTETRGRPIKKLMKVTII